MFARPTISRSALLLLLAAACWGLGSAISKRAVEEVPPFTLLAVQLSVSVLGLVALSWLRGGLAAPARGSWALNTLGLLNPGLAYALGLLALTQMTVSLYALLWAIEPLMILALAIFFLHEHPSRMVLGLSAIALSGIVLVVYDPGGTGTLWAVALQLAGIGCCAAYTILARRFLADTESTLDVVMWQQAGAAGLAVLLVVGGTLLGGNPFPDHLSAGGAVSALGSGLVYYGLAYWCYLTALRNLPASLAATSFYLVPVFGLIGGFGLGERLDALQWLGAIVVIGALAVIAHRHSASHGRAELLMVR